jgi:hypothetical protein
MSGLDKLNFMIAGGGAGRVTGGGAEPITERRRGRVAGGGAEPITERRWRRITARGGDPSAEAFTPSGDSTGT